MATEPKSLANSQFCSLGTFNYNSKIFFIDFPPPSNILLFWILFNYNKSLFLEVLADDFCHKKLGTFKIKGATAKNTVFLT